MCLYHMVVHVPAAECAWPGREGAACALSAMLRRPLACSLLHFVPLTASYQAAFAGGAP